MRLIDADKLRDEVLKWLPSDPCGAEEKEMPYETDIVVSMMLTLEEAPSIDICFCRECKYASNDGTYGCMCEHFNDTSDAYHRMWSDDFCSYGEVSEKPTGSEKPNNLERSSE